MYLGGPCVWAEPLFKNPEPRFLVPWVLHRSLVSLLSWRIPPASCFWVSFLLSWRRGFCILVRYVLVCRICSSVFLRNISSVLARIVGRRLHPWHLDLSSCDHCFSGDFGRRGLSFPSRFLVSFPIRVGSVGLLGTTFRWWWVLCPFHKSSSSRRRVSLLSRNLLGRLRC